MKTIACLALYACVICGAMGQGTVRFENYFSGSRPTVDAPFFDDRGLPLSGTNYVAQLFAGTSADVLVAVGTPVPFLTGAGSGYFRGGEVTIPATIVGFGGPGWVQARAWEAVGGPTFEEAALSGRWTGISGILYLKSTGGSGGGSPSGPAPLIGFKYPGSPIIVQEPQNQKLRAGEKANFSVVASGGVALSYQWHQGESGDTNKPISGATNASFTTPSLSADTSYWVKAVTSAGSTNSATAMVTVLPANAARLGLRLVSGVPTLSIDGPVGTTYRIDYLEDLSAKDWMTLTNVTMKSDPMNFTDTTATDSSARFYRVVVP